MAMNRPNISAKVANIAGLHAVCLRLGFVRTRGDGTGTEPSVNALLNAIANGHAVVTREKAKPVKAEGKAGKGKAQAAAGE